MTYGEVRATTVIPVFILDSRFWGTHIWGVNLMQFLMFFCIFGVFLGGIWDSGGGWDSSGDSWK